MVPEPDLLDFADLLAGYFEELDNLPARNYE
jgi:hypothetical protein